MMLRKKRSARTPTAISKNPNADKAYNALLRRITRRDLSEKEIRTKMGPWHEAEAIDAAIKKAQDYGLLKSPQVLAERWAEALHRRGKGAQYIQNSLKQRGLPALEPDAAQEIKKCRQLIEKKWDTRQPLSYTERTKAYRYLTNRGFQLETVKQALSLSFSASAHEEENYVNEE